MSHCLLVSSGFASDARVDNSSIFQSSCQNSSTAKHGSLFCWLESKDGQPALVEMDSAWSSRACNPNVIHSVPCAAILASSRLYRVVIMLRLTSIGQLRLSTPQTRVLEEKHGPGSNFTAVIYPFRRSSSDVSSLLAKAVVIRHTGRAQQCYKAGVDAQ